MKNFIIVLVFLMVSQWETVAQQDAQYTQYMYNTITVNPAYAGSRGVPSFAALHRPQWVGLDGAPTTQTLNFNMPVSNRVGLGVSIINDEIGNGTSQETSFDAVFSYSVPTSDTGKLSFGLKVGGHSLNINFNNLINYRSELVTSGSEDIHKKFSPNFGTGIYYHTNKFYAGLSIPNILETEHYDDSGSSASFLAQERMNWYLISGYVYDLNPKLKLKPAILIKAVSGAPLQADLSVSTLLDNKFSFGLAYRWDAALSAMFGFQISDQMMLGLAYDKETTDLGNTQFNDGSFEIFLRYEFFTRYKKVLTPRFF